MEKKSKILILFILGLVFVLIAVANNNVQINNENSDIILSNGQIPVSPIFIDDEDPNFNWSKTAAENEWCTGSGTWADPYIIENIIVETENQCIEIVSSSRPFIIRNSIFYSKIGITLRYVQNAYITNNTCNCNICISLYEARNNTIDKNVVHSKSTYAGEAGTIDLGYHSHNNTISNNKVYDSFLGLSLYYSNANDVYENKFVQGDHMIYLTHSHNNSIYNNSITDLNFVESYYNYGLELHYSQNNSIINNIIDGLGYSGYGLFGMSLRNSLNNSIQFNSINHCTESGIFLGTGSVENSLLYNKIIGEKSCISGNLQDNIILNNNLHWTDLPPLLIDDSDSLKSWEHCSINYDWCSNIGDQIDPIYLIENVTINGLGTNCCINIRNSARDFVIKDSKVFNSAIGVDIAGITLENVQKANIINVTAQESNVGIHLINSSYCKLFRNNASYNSWCGIIIDDDCTQVNITENIANNNQDRGIYIYYSDSNLISHNTFAQNEIGILLWRSNSNDLIGNICVNNTYSGFHSYLSCANNIIRGNIFNENDYGLRSWTGFNQNDIINNIMYKNDLIGLSLENSHSNYISSNNVTLNGIVDGSGIALSGSNLNTFINNYIIENQDIGISLTNSNNNNFTENRFLDNSEYGISITGFSHNNLIYDNRFVGNTLNAMDNSEKASAPLVEDWYQTWGIPGDTDMALDLALDPSNNIFLSGFTGEFTEHRILTVFNSAGINIFNFSSSGNRGNGITIDEYGNIYVTGETSRDLSFWKYNSNHSLVLEVQWGGSDFEAGDDIEVDSEGNIFISGMVSSGNCDSVLLKFNASGNLEWYQTFGTSEWEKGAGLVIDDINGDIYQLCSGVEELYLLKYNSFGVLQWVRDMNYTASDSGDLAIDSMGNIYITGYSLVGNDDLFIAGYDSSGLQLWNRTWGLSHEMDRGYDISINSNNDVYVVGITGSYGAGNYDACILKYSSMGDLIWDLTWGGAYLDYGLGIGIDSLDNIYICGCTASFGDPEWVDMCLVKFKEVENNQWNNSVIGNYWDDYVGEDLNDDGIGDTPYSIPGSAGSKDYLPQFKDKKELFIQITPQFLEAYMGDKNLDFLIQLTDLYGNPVENVPIEIITEQGYWDAYESLYQACYLNSFLNYSGTVFHNQTGTPIPENAFYLLNSASIPFNSLIIAPEILEYNPDTLFSRQQIEIDLEMDLSDFLSLYGLDPYQDISYIIAGILGSGFLETQYVNTDKNYQIISNLEIYNYLMDSYRIISGDYFNESLILGDPSTSVMFEDENGRFDRYRYGFDFNDLYKYIDSQNKITFRFYCYFEGFLKDPEQSYMSNFVPNSVLGAMFEYADLEVIWWKENPEKVILHNYHTEYYYHNTNFTYTPTCPGTYTIYFKTRLHEQYKEVEVSYTIEVKRRPTGVWLEVPSEHNATEELELIAHVFDTRNGIEDESPAIGAIVNFYSDYKGFTIHLGRATTDIYGIARLNVGNLYAGMHSIWAIVEENHGRYSEPFQNILFEKDIWAVSYSDNYSLNMKLSNSSLSLISLAPEGYNVIVDQQFYIYPKLVDTITNKEILNEDIEIYINGTFYGIFKSSIPFLLNFSEPGTYSLEGYFDGTQLLNNCNDSKDFKVIRLELKIIDIFPTETILLVDQELEITIFARDLTTNLPVVNLNISLYTSETGWYASGTTNSEGIIKFLITIPENWAAKMVYIYAQNTPEPHKYLQQKTEEFSRSISPFETEILLNINSTELYIWEHYDFTFSLVNLDTQELIDNEVIRISYIDGVNFYEYNLTTSYNNTITLSFPLVGSFDIEATFYESNLYKYSTHTFTIEVQKRPTFIEVSLTDKELVPGNEFSIMVNLIDSISNSSINENKIVSIIERIYDNGTLVVNKDPIIINTQYNATFGWQPLREADFEFEFIYTYDEFFPDPVYQPSNLTIYFNVTKRQVWIDSIINSYSFKVGDIIEVNSTFVDLNTTNLELIPDLLVHYMIFDGEEILFSENFTTNSQGIIDFSWQIPQNLVNRSLEILIISAATNFYQWAYDQLLISTKPLETMLDITVHPNPHSYVNEDIILEVELISILGDNIKENINYEIYNDDKSFYQKGVIDLEETSIFPTSFSEPGRYIFKFSYNGSQIYSPTDTEIIYYVVLYPSTLTPIDYQEFVYSAQDVINVSYQLVDTFTQLPIEGCLIQLKYVDLATSSLIQLTESTTDLNGIVSFSVILPEGYSYPSIILVAEASQTGFNEATLNTIEIFITKTPSYLNIFTLTDSVQYYIDEITNITVELYDIFGNLLTNEMINVEIETPTTSTSIEILCNESFELLFQELGLYFINATFYGSDTHLQSSTDIYFAVSPVPSSLEMVEDIPEVLYPDEFLFLKTQLKNNLTSDPIEGELVKFYISNGTSTYLMYEDITDSEGHIFYIWEVNNSFINQDVSVYAVYDYEYYYENSSSHQISIFISKYLVDLSLFEFPETISPLKEIKFIIQANKEQTGAIADQCHLQIFITLPNGSRILIIDDFANYNGILEFYWTPHEAIFNFNEVNFEIYVIEDDMYYGGLITTKLVPIEKLQTFISIIPEKTYVLPGEIISIHFALENIFGIQLTDQVLFVEINNPLFHANLNIVIGFNDTYFFTIPNYGPFEIIASYEGNERNYPSSETSLIYCEKLELLIDFSILEAFSTSESTDFLGTFLNYRILDFHKNFTLVANVTIKEYKVALEDVNVSFYFLQKNMEPILIGSNYTDEKGIAIYYWDISNYSTPNWWKKCALIAKVDETEYNYAAESNPIYFNLRKVKTLLAIEVFTSQFRIDVNYAINITLYDEFLIKLKGYEISVDIYFHGKIIQSYELMTSDTTHFNFTPSKLGNYIIKAYFGGTEEYKESHITEMHKCVDKEPTNIKLFLPEYIKPGQIYNLELILFNSTGDLLIGEHVEVEIMYHDDSGATEYIYLDVIIGTNNTFEWIFPDYDEYVIKASYRETDDYLGSKVIIKAKNINVFSLSFWETFFMFLVPALMIIPSSRRKNSNWSKRKRIFIAMFIVLMILLSFYSEITFICSQTQTKGLLTNVKGESNYVPNNPAVSQTESTLNDLLDYGVSKIENINPDHIPYDEDDTSPYDIITPNSTIIPPEADITGPYLEIEEPLNNNQLRGLVNVKVIAIDRESDIKEVKFTLLYNGFEIREEGFFSFNESLERYIYPLNTSKHNDGIYEIYAEAMDLNNNTNKAQIEVEFRNNPIYDLSDLQSDLIIVELTDTLNVSFRSLANGSYSIYLKNLQYKTIISVIGKISANETKKVEIPIDPIYFDAQKYLIIVAVTAHIPENLNILKTQTKELQLKVIKESVKLELDIREGENIYTNHNIQLRARLIEQDTYITEEGEAIANFDYLPISGQLLTFKISDSDNQFILGNALTDSNGYATFLFNVTLTKGLHLFNISYSGNNIYLPLETMKSFENKGRVTFTYLSYVSPSVAYNEFATIRAILYGDNEPISSKPLYFNITNSLGNHYLGMAMTDFNGEAIIDFPCSFLPGNYNIIVSYEGDDMYSETIANFENTFEIKKQNIDLSILGGVGSLIYCPYYYNTTLLGKALIHNTDIGIEGLSLKFSLIKDSTPYFIGETITNNNGYASLMLNPSELTGIIPGSYNLIVEFDESTFYNEASDIIDLEISKDLLIISVEGVESLFNKEFQINATLTDSLLNPLESKKLHFFITNKTDDTILFNDSAITDNMGIASLTISAGMFLHYGTFNLEVSYSASENNDNIHLSTSKIFENSIHILPLETKLYIQGAEKVSVIDSYNVTVFLLDYEGQPISNQIIIFECYRERGTTNLLDPAFSRVTTDINGNANFSIYLDMIGFFVLKAFFDPIFDDNVYNDGFIASQAEIKFLIERAKADLSVTFINLPSIKRGQILEFTVEAGLEAAKREIIPIDVYIEGVLLNRFHLFDGAYRFLKNGISLISFNIPMGDKFQAGEYNISIIIDEEWSKFEGNTSFTIDLVERTRLSIQYRINNQRAKGKHYLWENETIEFSLVDEDGDPIEESSNELLNGSTILHNRYVRYTISNGIITKGTVEIINGYTTIDYIPESIGIEICAALYEGCRFFAPTKAKNRANILKRPLVLYFLDFWHNNSALRPDAQYSGHRGEKITVRGRVQDYLSQIFVPNHLVQFGYNRINLEVFNVSNNDGYVYLDIDLSKKNGLIQAGKYKPRIRIRESAHYQSVVAWSSKELQIFEIGHFICTKGDITMKDMNYVLKTTLNYIDEDGKLNKKVKLYLQVIYKHTGKVVYSDEGFSGEFDIPVFDGGNYEIRITITDKNFSVSEDIHLIASLMLNDSLFVAKLEKDHFTIYDPLVIGIYIWVFSELVTHAMAKIVTWRGDFYTRLILYLLYFTFGIKKTFRFTWASLIKFFVLLFVLRIFNFDNFYLKFVAQISLEVSLDSIFSALKTGEWLINGISIVVGTSIFVKLAKYFIGKIGKKNQTIRQTIKDAFKFNSTIVKLEMGIIFLYALVKQIENVIPAFLRAITYDAFENLWYIKSMMINLILTLPFIVVLYIVIIVTIAKYIVEPIVWIIIPKASGWFAWLKDILRNLLRIALNVLLIVAFLYLFNVAAIVISSITSKVIDTITKKFIKQIATEFFYKYLFEFIDTVIGPVIRATGIPI